MQCPTCGPSSRQERAIMRVRFIALSALFPFLHPIYRHRKNAKASNAAAPNMRHARLELCKAKTQDVSQRGRTTIDVVLLLFCIISCSSIPSSRHKKAPGPQMQPRQTCVTRGFALGLELSLAMSDLRAFKPPRTGYPARSFYCTFCIISIPSSHLPAQKSAGASNAGVPNMRIAACLAA